MLDGRARLSKHQSKGHPMSNTKTEAQRLADELRSHVQTYPQMSEDEPGGYCSQDDQLMDEAATELLSLDAQNKAMHKIIDQLRAQVDQMQGGEPVTLTDDEINSIWSDGPPGSVLTPWGIAKIRAIIAALREKGAQP